jgi:hypothetical protein
VARWFDPVTAHFAQADTEAPQLGQPQTFDRYMYANQNPIRYNDPTGHDAGMGCLPYWDRYTYSGYNYHYDFYSELRDSVSYFQSPIHSTPITMAAQFNVSISSNNAAANYVQPTAPSVQISHSQWSVAAQWASNVTSIGPVLLKGLKGSSFNPVLSAIGSTLTGYSQWEKDSDYPYTTGQRWGRAGLAGLEGGGISIIANEGGIFAGGVGMGLTGVSMPIALPENLPPGFFAGYVVGYLAVSNDLSTTFNNLNEKNIYPFFNLSLDPSRQCKVRPDQ